VRNRANARTDDAQPEFLHLPSILALINSRRKLRGGSKDWGCGYGRLESLEKRGMLPPRSPGRSSGHQSVLCSWKASSVDLTLTNFGKSKTTTIISIIMQQHQQQQRRRRRQQHVFPQIYAIINIHGKSELWAQFSLQILHVVITTK